MLTFKELASAASGAVRALDLDAAPVGVLPGGSERNYAEVVISVGGVEPRRVMVGVDRTQSPEAVQTRIMSELVRTGDRS